MLKRGFTLIELLVVIAIIGILAAVVLGSLNDARDNANDASAQTSVNNIRNVAETWYSDNGFTYGDDDNTMAAVTQVITPVDDGGPTDGICADAEVQTLMAAAGSQTRESGLCVANDNAYAIEVLLRNANYYCIDSTGFAGQTGAASTLDGTGAADADVTCGP